MKTNRTSIVFQKGHASLYKGKKLIGTFKYQENQLVVDVVILGLASKWTPLKRTLARAALAKKRRDDIRRMNAIDPKTAFTVQPRYPHFASLPILSKVVIAPLSV